MATLTDLTARLASGDPIEIARLTRDGETVIEHGRFDFIGQAPGGTETLYVRRHGLLYDVPRGRLRYVSPVDPAVVAASYRPGERVIVRKYGSDYTGTIVAVGRTRLTVRIVLGAGTSRERERDLTINALDVTRPRLETTLL